MADADDAGDQRHRDDDVQPLLDDFAVNARHLDQDEAQQCAQNQFPVPFNPTMDDPPPAVAGLDGIGGQVERRQEQQGQSPQPTNEDEVQRGLAAFQQRHGDVEQQGQRHQHNADLGW